MYTLHLALKSKGKVLPYSLPSVGQGADPGLQAVSPQATLSNPPGSRLPLLSARPAVTFPAEERHRPSTSSKLYCLVTEAYICEQLAKILRHPTFSHFEVGGDRMYLVPCFPKLEGTHPTSPVGWSGPDLAGGGLSPSSFGVTKWKTVKA